MKYKIQTESEFGSCRFSGESVIFEADGDHSEIFFRMHINFCDWENDAYIMMPACAYNGNRYPRVRRKYPPMYRIHETGEAGVPLIGDLPALNPDGSGEIQVTAGDMATPCVGIFYREAKKGFLLYTEQAVLGKNLGFSVKAGSITVSFPSARTEIYRAFRLHEKSDDTGISVSAGETISSAVKILTFDCEDIPRFYEKYFETRKCLLRDERTPKLYTWELWKLMEAHFNSTNWSGEYYAESSKVWQCGWVGGGMSSYPLLKHGSVQSVMRALATLDFLTAHQAPSGFFYGLIRGGVIEDDSFGNEALKHLHLVRKSADALYFLLKHFDVITPKASWVSSARACADAFVKIFRTYQTFGQFVNIETGELVVSCSSAGAMAIGALVRASQYFNDAEYLETAKAAGDFYYRAFICEGMTSGAVGEALCAPESESSFAFIESYIALYEATGEQKWLAYAKDAANLFSSWVVTYAYCFPDASEFARLGINTVGSVFANVQNKHSAPGICSHSGDSIYKLYLYTHEERYLGLILDIVSFIPQCVSTETRPIFAGDKKMPAGYINERVNMSDWEGKHKIGEIFYGSCWCETSLLLTFSELIWKYGLSW